LGKEVPLEEIPFIQKSIIAKANAAGKPVITATQMLLSMVEHPEPTRAEVTDVEEAIMDGSDAVMLSEETSIGRFPAEAVAMMERIVLEAEKHRSESIFHSL
jgi:pyruvate kinase